MNWSSTPHPIAVPRLLLCVGLGEAAAAPTAELALHGWRCHHAADVAQALQAASALRFDALLVSDAALHEDLLPRLSALRKATDGALLVLAAQGDEIDEIMALELGADDYLYPPLHVRRLRARLTAAVRPAAWPEAPREAHELRQLPIQRGGFSLQLDTGLLRGGSHEFRLTEAQAAVLGLFLKNAGDVLSRGEVARHLGLPHGPAAAPSRSIDMHLHHLRRRLSEEGIDEIVLETVRGQGYRLRLKPADAPRVDAAPRAPVPRLMAVA